MALAPHRFNFPCQFCETELQSQPEFQGSNQACPKCGGGFIVPDAPPRKIGGWLAFLIVVASLGWIYNLLWFAVAAGNATYPRWIFVLGMILATQAAGIIGMMMKKAWSRWAYPAALVFSTTVQVIFADPSDFIAAAIGTVIWSLYLFRSKRVRETLVR